MSGIIAKNGGAKAWIPTESEWYKAAYYDPNKGGAGVGGYWAQATQSNTMTGNTIGVAGAANFIDSNGYTTFVNGGFSSWGITDVGAYGLNSESAYGTNDQAGNVLEWNDAVISSSSRGLRGGSWFEYDGGSSASLSRGTGLPLIEGNNIGFRVASVPEPSAVLLTMLSASALLTRRRRSTL